MGAAPLLEADDIAVRFSVPGAGIFRRDLLQAVRGVSFAINPGEALGVVGESGCGKSTLARAALRLAPLHHGTVRWEGTDLHALPPQDMRALRARMQVIFQDPLSALNPRMTCGETIAEPMRLFFPDWDQARRQARVEELMAEVGLLPRMRDRYPHEFSGGQAQRIGIARALAGQPSLLVCDEPVSALDVSVQAQILNLLARLRDRHGLALLFISHDLSVVRHLCDRVLVLYLGRVVEEGPTARLFDAPRHPYTRALLDAAPSLDPDRPPRPRLSGEPPSPVSPPPGCPFTTRCPHVQPGCAARPPGLEEVKDGHAVACVRWQEIPAAA